jgi:predicted acylesterase/phospholipase RssA
MKYERVAVVLSGGGAKAAAHVGVMRALEEWEVKPAHYVGTSMGAVVAAMFACGLDYDDVLKRMLLISRQDVATPSISLLLGPFATSLLSGKKLRDAIRELVPYDIKLFLDSAVAFGALVSYRHTSKSKNDLERKKYYPHPILGG